MTFYCNTDPLCKVLNNYDASTLNSSLPGVFTLND